MKRLYIFLACGTIMTCILAGCGNKADNYYNDGLAYYNKSDYSKAVECFQKAIEVNSDNSEYVVSLGMSLLEAGDTLEAVNTFMSLIETDPNNRGAYRGLGIAYMRDGKYTEAETYFAKVEELSEKADSIYLDSMKYRAECCYEIGRYNECILIYDTIIGKAAKEQRYMLYYLRGKAYIQINDENSAVLNFEEALKLKGNDYRLYCSMYEDFKAAGYKERSESYIKRIMQQDGISEYDRGKFYFILGNYTQAESIFVKEFDEGNVEAAYYLAETYKKQNLPDKTEKLYQKLLLEQSKDYRVYNQYGEYLISQKEYKKALDYIEEGLLLAKDKEKRELLYNQAVCYEFMFEYKKAYELFSDYIEEYPNDAQARKELEFLSTR